METSSFDQFVQDLKKRHFLEHKGIQQYSITILARAFVFCAQNMDVFPIENHYEFQVIMDQYFSKTAVNWPDFWRAFQFQKITALEFMLLVLSIGDLVDSEQSIQNWIKNINKLEKYHFSPFLSRKEALEYMFEHKMNHLLILSEGRQYELNQGNVIVPFGIECVVCPNDRCAHVTLSVDPTKTEQELQCVIDKNCTSFLAREWKESVPITCRLSDSTLTKRKKPERKIVTIDESNKNEVEIDLNREQEIYRMRRMQLMSGSSGPRHNFVRSRQNGDIRQFFVRQHNMM